MADLKISQLTGATIPLAGTEVLPIVQGGATKKVTIDDLTVKNIRSNATTGVLQVTGPAAASTRVMTVPDANFTAARTDAAQSFTGDQTLATGNLVIGTAGKGIDFSADPNAGGMTSELLDDYEEGTWTPNIGGNATYNSQSGYYTKIGRQVTAFFLLFVNVQGTGSQTTISGLPFTASNTTTIRGGGSIQFFANLAINVTWLAPSVAGGSSEFYFVSQGAIDNLIDDGPNIIQDGFYVMGSVVYFVD